jgi:fatty-acyl-CoA synthase
VDIGDGAGRLVVLVEPRDGHPDFSVMAEQIASSARASAGVRIDECVFLSRGALPKTPSGKVQRFRCRELAQGTTQSNQVRIAL